MKILNSKLKHRNFLLPVGLAFCLSLTIFGQKRDNLTDKEDMQVREAQELDLRMKTYVKIIDRRFLAINNANPAQDKQVQKDLNTFGEIRSGSSKDLYWDILKTLDEAIQKIDNAAARDERNPLFAKAVRILTDGCQKWIPLLKSGLDKAADEKEKGLILSSVDLCEQVIEASAKVPKEETKKKGKDQP